MQGGFCRLRMKLPSGVQERERILDVIWYLHNYRTRMFGINQIATVYQKLWQPAVIIKNYHLTLSDLVDLPFFFFPYRLGPFTLFRR
ncbi:hypothetical protein BD770DRAFT_356199 [Pilaira anomala]|nr:hypothetical protein BD770DRAFT_356199 [Pilaira anomala]